VETRNSAPLFLTLIAVVAAFYPATLKTHGQGKPVAVAAVMPVGKSVESDGQQFPTAKDLVSQFLLSSPDEQKTTPLSGAGYTIDFLIATVPDPMGSRLPYFFDSFVDSLAGAAEATGFAPDRFALPWTVKSTESGDNAPARSPALYETQPGIVLFRNPQEGKLLLLFLVGETPTAGIYKPALYSALNQAAQFYPWDPHHSELPQYFPKTTADGGPPDLAVAPPLRAASAGLKPGATPQAPADGTTSTLRMMAPAFSGSAVSLSSTLDSWLESRAGSPPVQFKIVSGTATAIDAKQLSQGVHGRATFQATVPPDDETLQAVANYIQGLGYPRIAILTEGNTAYGQHLAQKFSTEKKRRSHREEASGHSPGVPEVLTLPFPMHISRLRTASEGQSKQKEQTDEGTETGKILPPHHASLGGAEAPREVLPSFSEVSVASAELMLSNLLSTIARERYSYVGIVATDVRDATFLAREVRNHCPATVLFVVNADLLYAYPDVNDFTLGMIVFTPYPLFNLEQLWTYAYQGAHTRLQFSSGAAEGVYNATLALLGQDGMLVDYGEPLARAADAQAGGLQKPSLWVTAVGNGETLPVNFLKWQDRGDYTFGARRTAADSIGGLNIGSGIYTENSVVVVIAASLLFSVFAVLLLAEYRRGRKYRDSRVSALVGDTTSAAYWSECRMFLLCCCASMAALYLVVAGDFFLPLFAAREAGSGVETTISVKVAMGLAGLTLLLLAAATYTMATAFRTAPSDQRGSAPEVVLFVYVACSFGILLSGFLVNRRFAAVRAYPANGLFDYLRSFNLGGGLSPLLPLACVAIGACLWALCSYRRLRLLDILRASKDTETPRAWLSFLPLDVPSFRGVRQLEANLKRTLESSSVLSLKAYAALAALAVLIATYFFHERMVRALEPRAFYWLFEAAFFIVYWALLMEFIRLVLAWRSLHALLARLSWHPMLCAYKRFRECCPVLAKVNLTSPPSRFAILEASVNQADLLLTSAETLAQSAGTDPVLARAIREALPDWRIEVRTAEAELAEALGLEWAAGSRGAPSSVPDPARKQRAKCVKGNWRRALECQHSAQRALTRFLQALAKPLEHHWRPHEQVSTPWVATPEGKEFFDRAEEFIVSRVVSLLAIVFPPLQNLGYFVLAGLLLMLLAVTSYPFQPRNEFLLFNWIVILSFVGMVFWIFVQMNRNTVLSLLNGTTPGEFNVNREVMLRILLYIIAPLLALLGAQFPTGLRQILSVFTVASGGAG